ncbi:hypothetical protein [Pseudoroseomonas cervicalis]|uniref:hypothetical protein n=1 Tax=Teichococcus cervicalis TaxID=204525 RepID=UPI0022F194E6|nr:hypothetical protein [Pseudoroseomonas cervicalis]WBV41355.1 hypothetical protein PFY06_08785 [Pseudoroseomonas cervicalis]
MARDAIGTILGERPGRRPARAAGLVLLAGLAGCSAASFTGPRDTVPTDSLTAQRILGRAVEVPPLLPAPGNVWPEGEETRRATMADPDVRPADPLAVPQPLPRQQRGSSTPPDLLAPGTTVGATAPRFATPAEPPPPPPPRRDGRVIPTPQGPAVTTGGGAGYSTYTTPGGGSGIAIPQGGTTTLLGQDGTVRQVPTPR